MKNIESKQTALILMFLGILTQHTPNTFTMNPEKPTPLEECIPLNSKDQSMIDDIVQKYKLGSPGDYKGYIQDNIRGNIGFIRENKKFIINPAWLNNSSKEEKQFAFGTGLAHELYPLDVRPIAKQVAIKIGLSCAITTTIGQCIDEKIGEKHNHPSTGFLLDCAIGLALGIALVPYFFKTEFEPEMQKIQYKVDEMTVETFDSHQNVINILSAAIIDRDLAAAEKNENLNTKIADYMNLGAINPAPFEQRIERIKELLRKKELLKKEKSNKSWFSFST